MTMASGQAVQASVALPELGAQTFRVARWFWLLAAAHLVIWTALPWLLHRNLPLDVIEALAWGQQWQWGYDKHPPLSAWAAELAAIAGGRSDLALYLLSQICVVAAMWFIWRLGRDLTDEVSALAAVMLLQGVIYVQFTSSEFNVNVLQMPLWAAAMWCFWRGVQGGGLGWWLGLGLAMGLGMLTKYLAAFAAVPMLGYLLLSPVGRRQWGRPGLYIAFLVAAALMVPHVWWMSQNDWQTLRYGLARADAGERQWLNHLVHPLRFIVAQMAVVAALVALTALVGSRLPRRSSEAQARLWAALAAFTPVLAMAVLSLLTGMRLRSMWGVPMVLGVSLWVVCRWDCRALAGLELRRALGLWAIVALLPVVAYFGYRGLGPTLTGERSRVHFPGPELAQQVSGRWQGQFGDQPLAFVVGDEWLAGNASWYGAQRPAVYLNGDPAAAPWIDSQQVARQGAAVLWHTRGDGSLARQDQQMLDALNQRYDLQFDEPITLMSGTLRGGRPIVVGLAWIAPAKPQP
jgi:4-amino-4-deoxy-L-arabinose transferase-like glycosyltransferase